MATNGEKRSSIQNHRGIPSGGNGTGNANTRRPQTTVRWGQPNTYNKCYARQFYNRLQERYVVGIRAECRWCGVGGSGVSQQRAKKKRTGIGMLCANPEPARSCCRCLSERQVGVNRYQACRATTPCSTHTCSLRQPSHAMNRCMTGECTPRTATRRNVAQRTVLPACREPWNPA